MSTPVRRDIQGLRALAVVVVVLYHFKVSVFRGGFIGVDVFFVISGFVITSALRREWAVTGKVSLVSFYARRARRILPAATVVALSTLAVSLWWFGRTGSVALLGDVRAAALFVANFHFAALHTGYFTANAAPSPLLHYWSLAVEEQFYVLVPLLFVPFSRLRRGATHLRSAILLVTVGSLALSIVETRTSPISAYYNLLTRAWELGVGCMATWIPVPARTGSTWLWWGGLLAIAVSVFGYSASTPFPGSAALLPVVGAACCIVGGATARDVSSAIFRSPLASWLGDRSFSLYLWHFPVFILGTSRFGGHVAHLRIYLFITTFALAALSYRWIEQPARHSSFLQGRALLSIGTGIGAVMATVLLVQLVMPPTGANATTSSPGLVAIQSELRSAVSLHDLRSSVRPIPMDRMSLTVFSLPRELSECTSHNLLIAMPICTFGDTRSPRSILLYGNSQAEMYTPTLDWFGRHYHWRIDVLSKPACGVFIDPHYVDEMYHQTDRCVRFARYAASVIRRRHYALVIVAATPGLRVRPGASTTLVNGRLPLSVLEYPPRDEVVTSVQSFVRAAGIRSQRLVLISLMPTGPSGQPNPCLLTHTTSIQQCGALIGTTRSAFSAAATAVGAQYLNVTSLYCTATTCPPVVDGVLVRFDAVHITALYAMHIAKAFSELLLAVDPWLTHPVG